MAENTLSDQLKKEKSRRIYYQGIVYDICNLLDQTLGTKTTCGTVDFPCRDVQRGMELLLTRLYLVEKDKK